MSWLVVHPTFGPPHMVLANLWLYMIMMSHAMPINSHSLEHLAKPNWLLPSHHPRTPPHPRYPHQSIPSPTHPTPSSPTPHLYGLHGILFDCYILTSNGNHLRQKPMHHLLLVSLVLLCSVPHPVKSNCEHLLWTHMKQNHNESGPSELYLMERLTAGM